MLDSMQLNKTTITITDDEFASGFQIGYLHFKTGFLHIPITDDLVYTVIMQNMVNVQHADHCNAGYVFGRMSALLEGQAEQHVHLATVIPFPVKPSQRAEV